MKSDPTVYSSNKAVSYHHRGVSVCYDMSDGVEPSPI